MSQRKLLARKTPALPPPQIQKSVHLFTDTSQFFLCGEQRRRLKKYITHLSERTLENHNILFRRKMTQGSGGGGGTRRPFGPSPTRSLRYVRRIISEKLRLENATNYVILENVRFF